MLVGTPWLATWRREFFDKKFMRLFTIQISWLIYEIYLSTSDSGRDLASKGNTDACNGKIMNLFIWMFFFGYRN